MDLAWSYHIGILPHYSQQLQGDRLGLEALGLWHSGTETPGFLGMRAMTKGLGEDVENDFRQER